MAQNITTLLEKDYADTLSGNDLFYLVQGTGSNRDRKLQLSALVAYIMAGGSNEMTLHKLTIGGAYWEDRQNVGPVIEGLHFVIADSAEFNSVTIKSNAQRGGNIGYGSNGPFINSFYSISANVLEGVTLDISGNGSIDGNLGVTGDVTVGGDIGVTGDANITGDLSADDVIATGTVTADGGFESNSGDIKTSNGNLEVGGHVKFGTGSIYTASTSGDESSITSSLSSLSDGTVALIVNKTGTALQFNDNIFAKTLFQVPGYTAIQVVKVDGKVYPVGGDYV
ncbi:polymer-forming cytoskeletal protein [Fibrobacter sp. UWH4]|uniref:polymer-forming cytoskeletal protein n=1 Tax=Fibrobacter sp. UWH4 TaxID=1896210 RepID=UPI00091F792C|nr:polymer-forming cytoskeletal protein [Fibrobacter sp. UWH4]SHL04270.1 hypothetical protein SAMN05720762_10444 [Fibrobacter sp. UWH4]